MWRLVWRRVWRYVRVEGLRRVVRLLFLRYFFSDFLPPYGIPVRTPWADIIRLIIGCSLQTSNI